MKINHVNILKYIFSGAIVWLLLSGPTIAYARYDYNSGWYTNLCGSGTYGGTYSCSADCRPGEGKCFGPGESVVKWTCGGESIECRGGESAWTSYHDLSGATCGKTYQIDVFNKKCRRSDGSWDSSCQLQGYLVWYSGNCSQPTSPPPPPQCGSAPLVMIEKGEGFKWYGGSVTIAEDQKVCHKPSLTGFKYSSRQTRGPLKGVTNNDGTQCFTLKTADPWTTGEIEAYENTCTTGPNDTCIQEYSSESCRNVTDVVVGAATPTPKPTPSPTPTLAPGIIRARAVVSDDTPTCDELFNPDTPGVPGVSLGLVPNPGVTGITSGGYKTWNAIPVTNPPTQFSVTTLTMPTNYSYSGLACFEDVSGRYAGSSTTLEEDESVVWHVGFAPPDPWVQLQGGDAYARGLLASSIPTDAATTFNISGDSGFPGVVIYGSGFRFTPNDDGRDRVSHKNWLSKDSYEPLSFFTAFYTMLGAPDENTWSGGSSPSCSPSPCIHYATGLLVTSGNWTIAASQKMIILVNGSLTIGGNIHVAPGGFLAFIVKNGINIADTVGRDNPDSTSPVLEGVYITGGVFDTGGGSKKLVGKGVFFADSFSLRRNFGGTETNDNPAEFFIYDPQILVAMPEEMMESLFQWQEIAP